MNRLIVNSILLIYFFVSVSHSQPAESEYDLESARNFLSFPPASAAESRILFLKPTLLLLSSIFLIPLTLIFLIPLGLLALVGIITPTTGTALFGKRKRSARDLFDNLNNDENRLLLGYGEERHQQSRKSQLLQSSKLEAYLNGFLTALEDGFFGPESSPS